MKYRLVVADVDGTLIAPGVDSSQATSERLIRAVNEVQKLGVIFSLATARSLDKVEGLIKSLSLNSLIILDNGARIYDCLVQKYISNSFIPHNQVKEILNILSEFQYEVNIINDSGRIQYNPSSKIPLTDIVKIVILDISPFQAQEVYERISNMQNISVTKSVSGSDPVKESIHITGMEAKKEKALKKIADLSGINLQSALVIGDSYNDFSIMAISGFKVAMGNSVSEIKAIADYIAPSYQEDGVAHVLEKFILDKNE